RARRPPRPVAAHSDAHIPPKESPSSAAPHYGGSRRMRALARLITVGGPQAARAVCALASLASAVPLIRLRYEQPRHTRPVSGSGARQVSGGLRALGPDTGLRLIAPLGFVQTFLRGCATVLVIVVAIDLLGGGDADIGVLNAAIGLGTLVGSFVASADT